LPLSPTSLGGSTSARDLTIQQNLLTVQQNLITQQQTIDSAIFKVFPIW